MGLAYMLDFKVVGVAVDGQLTGGGQRQRGGGSRVGTGSIVSVGL